MSKSLFTFKKSGAFWKAYRLGCWIGNIGKRKPPVKGWGEFYIDGVGMPSQRDNFFQTRDEAAFECLMIQKRKAGL